VLKGVVADHSLKSAGEEVGGVEKRRQALARFQGQRAGEGPDPVHRHHGQTCWQAGIKGSLLPRGRNVGDKFGLVGSVPRRRKCPLPYCNTIQTRTVRGRSVPPSAFYLLLGSVPALLLDLPSTRSRCFGSHGERRHSIDGSARPWNG
jgi:hypothetical protein